MGVGQVLSALKALGSKEHFLEGIKITDIFPRDEKDFVNDLPESVEKMKSMMNDPKPTLLLSSVTDYARQKMRKSYLGFNNEFQKDIVSIKKAWVLAQKYQALKEKFEPNFDKAYEHLLKSKDEVEESKAKMQKLRDESQSVGGIKEVLESLKKQIEEKKELRAKKIITEKGNASRTISEGYNKQKQEAEKILDDYAKNKKLNEKEKKELKSGKYTWGVTVRDEAKKAKDAYLLLHKLEEWKKEHFEAEMKFLENPEKYDKGEFNAFHKELENLDKEIKELQKLIDTKVKESQKMSEAGTKLTQKVQKKSEQGSSFAEYMDAFYRYTQIGSEVKPNLEKEIEYYSKVVADAQKARDAAQGLIDEYNWPHELKSKIENAQSGKSGATPSSGEIPLIIAVAKVYYFFNWLYEEYNKIVNKLKEKKKSIDALDKGINEKSLKKYKVITYMGQGKKN